MMETKEDFIYVLVQCPNCKKTFLQRCWAPCGDIMRADISYCPDCGDFGYLKAVHGDGKLIRVNIGGMYVYG